MVNNLYIKEVFNLKKKNFQIVKSLKKTNFFLFNYTLVEFFLFYSQFKFNLVFFFNNFFLFQFINQFYNKFFNFNKLYLKISKSVLKKKSLPFFVIILNCYNIILHLRYFLFLFLFFQIYKMNQWILYLVYYILNLFFFKFDIFLLFKQLKLFSIHTFVFWFCEVFLSSFIVKSLFQKSFNNNGFKFSYFSRYFKKKIQYFFFRKSLRQYRSNFFWYAPILKTASRLEHFLKKNSFLFHNNKKNLIKLCFNLYSFRRRRNFFIVVKSTKNNIFLTGTDFLGNCIFRLSKSFVDSNYFRKKSPLITEVLIDECVNVCLMKFNFLKKGFSKKLHRRYINKVLKIVYKTKNKHFFYNLDYLKWLYIRYKRFFYGIIIKYQGKNNFYRTANYHFKRLKDQLPILGKLYMNQVPFNGCRLRKRRRL